MGAVSDTLSDFDPTTKEGLLNIGTGGLYSFGKETGANDALANFDDQVSGRAAQDAIDDAAKDAAAVQQQMIDLYAQQYQDYLTRAQPYSEMGADAVKQLSLFMSPEAQQQYAQEQLQSDYFKSLQQSALDPMVSNAAALGNRLSSGIQEDILGSQGLLAQQFAQNAINDRMNQLQYGVNTGLGALSGTGAAGSAYTSGAANSMNNIANIQLQAANAAASQPNMMGGLAGAGLGALFGGGLAGAQFGFNIGSNV